MKPCKIAYILGTLITLSSPVSAFDLITTHSETSYGTVVHVEPIWNIKTNYRKTSSSSCDRTNFQSANLGKTLFGAALGSAVGNELTSKDGFGSIGAIVGAMVASDLNQHHGRTCVQETVHTPTQEQTLSHYLVDVKVDGKILQFKSKKTYQLYDQLPFQIETRIKPQISGIFTY